MGEVMHTPQADPFSYVPEWRRRFIEGGWWHSFELPDGSEIRGVSELASQKMRVAQFPIPADLCGKRVLDIGAWDGWFSFEMERRGAEVLAIDRFDNPRFHEIRERLGSRVEYRQLDVYDVGPSTVGQFDIVLFMGVLYHLKHPLLALEKVCSVTKEMAAIESFVLGVQHGLSDEQEARNLMQFFEDDDFGGQTDNWCAPTTACLLALCRAAGFARAELANRHDYGSAVTCFRQWAPQPPAAAPQLLAALNADDFGINFRSDSDQYVTTCGLGTDLTRDNVHPEVGGLGIRPVAVNLLETGAWLMNFKLPPGLPAGWHEVRLAPGGNALKIAVDIEPAAAHLAIRGACDGVSWKPSEVSLEDGFLSLWVEGLPENADLANVRVHVRAQRQTVTFVGPPDGDGVRQVNARVEGCIAGEHEVSVSVGAARSPGLTVAFVI